MKKLLTICLMLLGAVAQAQNFAITATTEAAIRKNIVKGNAANYGFGMINDTLKLVGLTTRNVIFTGSTSKTDIGLSNVDNTSDANKPVSTATQTALNLKANIASPTFTGTVSGITKSMVGLSNVDNTSDAGKPISTATQTALDAKQATLNGTGFVKASGTTISYDNSTYLSTSTAASTYLPISNPTATGTLTAPTIANSLGATFATSSGNIGIGTASPSYKLDVNGTSRFQNTTSITGGVIAVAPSGVNGLHLAFGSDVGLVQAVQSGTSGRELRLGGYPLTFYSSQFGTEMSRFSTGGNLLLNSTTDTGEKLQVNGTIRAGTITSQSGALISARNTGNSFEFGHSNQAGYGSTLGANAGNGHSFLAFNAEAGTNINTFRTRGIIGRVITNDVTLNRLQFQRTTSSSADNQTPVTDMTIDGSGNVGIGTTTPQSSLHNYGQFTTGLGVIGNPFNVQLISSSSPFSGKLLFGTDGSGYKFSIGKNQGGTVTDLITVNDNGNIGIGTTSPAASAILDITSTTKGVLFPRMTTDQINAISSPANGLTVYNTTLTVLCFYDGTGWRKVSHSSM